MMLRHYKRPFDLSLLLASHIILAPMFLLLWIVLPIAIWANDRGPIFYVQLRLGKGGKEFRLYKFRSMLPDAENETGAVLASEDDPRVTSIGRLMRSTALDELPQVINLWRGELSLVGPRPERPELLAKIIRELPDFNDRLQVRPGLTGMAQVFGKYSSEPRTKLRYDRLYIKNMSPILDLLILAKSVLFTITGKWQNRVR